MKGHRHRATDASVPAPAALPGTAVEAWLALPQVGRCPVAATAAFSRGFDPEKLGGPLGLKLWLGLCWLTLSCKGMAERQAIRCWTVAEVEDWASPSKI